MGTLDVTKGGHMTSSLQAKIARLVWTAEETDTTKQPLLTANKCKQTKSKPNSRKNLPLKHLQIGIILF